MLKMLVLRIDCEYEPDVLGNDLWWGQWWWYKTSAQTEPFQAPKGEKHMFYVFYSSVIVTLMSGEFYIIVTGRDPSVLDTDPGC